MPLKLVPPREGKSPNWSIRGTYLGVRVDRTTGTAERRKASLALAAIRLSIESGTFIRPGAATFANASLRYLDSGGEDRFILRLAEFFGERPLTSINQEAVDEAATVLYPMGSPATRNRQVYTPVSAVLKAAGIREPLKRPKGGQGTPRLYWLTPEQAGRLLAAASELDSSFALLLTFLLYTGCRLSEALTLRADDLNLMEGYAYVRRTKNGDPRIVHLPPVLRAALADRDGVPNRSGKCFRLHKNSWLYGALDAAAKQAGVELPSRVAFHAFRHTWGAWMRRYGGLDTTGLVATGAWRSRQAAAIYEHAQQSEEARRADLLPDVLRRKK